MSLYNTILLLNLAISLWIKNNGKIMLDTKKIAKGGLELESQN